MSRTYNIASADLVDAARSIARRATDWRFRYRRWKQTHAMQDAALALGTTPRRVQALLRGELVRVVKEEHSRLLACFWRDMDTATAELRARADQMEREAEAERVAVLQFTLPFESAPKCSSRSGLTSFCGVGGERSRAVPWMK
jgi:hypothetical protein